MLQATVHAHSRPVLRAEVAMVRATNHLSCSQPVLQTWEAGDAGEHVAHAISHSACRQQGLCYEPKQLWSVLRTIFPDPSPCYDPGKQEMLVSLWPVLRATGLWVCILETH